VSAENDSDGEVSGPRETTVLFGHSDAEQQMLAAYRTGRMPHAWLIGGEPGIGKATLAYRLARFVLAHPDPNAADVREAKDLCVPPDNPVARRILAHGHSDLLVLERTLNDKGNLRRDIAVDDVRKTVTFFGSTAGEGGWRVCIVDSADDLNKEGANALLKILEEPPSRSLLLVVSHAPARLLPTIRSRCRKLALRPLDQSDLMQAAATALGISAADPQLQRAAALAQGSVARAIALYDGPTLALRERIAGLLARLPQTDGPALHALGDTLARADDATYAGFTESVRDWLTARLEAGGDTPALMRISDAWEKFNRAEGETAAFNLDRKPLIFSTFALLAEAVRG
jgi:DNA polymerase-3 subunit delta'